MPAGRYRRDEPCTVPGCERLIDRTNLGLCEGHYARHRRRGDFGTAPVTPKVAGPPIGSASPNWKGPDVKYDAAHKRVTRARGKASEHICAMNCGRQAAQWSIVRSDASPAPHSPDPADYRPLCVPCHKRYDLAALINEGWPHRRVVP